MALYRIRQGPADNPRMRPPSAASAAPSVVAILLAAATALAGCSPTFNWREQRLLPTSLQALMPCKPDEATRTVPLGVSRVEMRMVGCETGGATFAIAYAMVAPAGVGAMLGAWQDATLANFGRVPGPDGPAGRAFVPEGALSLPQSVRIATDGRGPDGTPLSAQAAWFAATAGRETYLFQALVYASRPVPEVADTFFSALRLR
jgi:hypothetical protein